MTIQQLQYICEDAAWWLPYNCLTTALWVPDDWQMPDDVQFACKSWNVFFVVPPFARWLDMIET
jgi:hypothetical protein